MPNNKLGVNPLEALKKTADLDLGRAAGRGRVSAEMRGGLYKQ